MSPRGDPQAVRAARRNEAALLGEALADAFAEEPVFAWLIPPQLRGRDNRIRMFFTSMSRGYLRAGKPCYLTSAHSAAALWARAGSLDYAAQPDHPRSSAHRAGLPPPPALRLAHANPDRKPARPAVPVALVPRLPRHPQRPARPGLGTQLLQQVLAHADTDGVPAYLESSNESNLPLYERNGFRVTGDLRALGHGPPIWRMWREPQPRT